MQSVKCLAKLIDQAAMQWPDKTALIFDALDVQLSFSALASTTADIARCLQSLGVTRGDRVAVMLPNVPAFPLVWLALSRIGGVIVPLNYSYNAMDALHPMNQSGAKLVITTNHRSALIDSIIEKLEAAPIIIQVEESTGEVIPALTAAGATLEAALPDRGIYSETLQNIQYTSGTTGLPKGCMLSQGYWVETARAVASSSLNIRESDTILTAQPFSYIDPQWNVAVSLLTGATLVVLERFSPSTYWEKVVRHNVTFIYCLGAMPTLMLAVPETPFEYRHQVRVVCCSAIPANNHRELERRFGVPWVEAYGTTESGPIIQVDLDDHDVLVGSACIGKPNPNREVRIVDEKDRPLPRGEVGELVVRGLSMMDGYYMNDRATQEAFRSGWYHTGDYGVQDEEGWFYLRGRKKDMIRRGGENIAAFEVEQCLQQHPLIKVAACVAVPDLLRGEEVKAYLVPIDGTDPEMIDFNEVAAFLSERLAPFKVPRYWEARSELPMTPSERVAKHLLREENTLGSESSGS